MGFVEYRLPSPLAVKELILRFSFSQPNQSVKIESRGNETWPEIRVRTPCLPFISTKGERHLQSPLFPNPADTKVNLGSFDWTVEFWFLPAGEPEQEGVIFEIGEGPRGENDRVTRLTLNANGGGFTLYNQPTDLKLAIPSSSAASRQWRHLAFVYSTKVKQLRHYVDGVLQPLPPAEGPPTRR